MPEDETRVRIHEDEDAVIAFLEDNGEEELTEQEKNLAIAQAKLIGAL